VCDSTFSEDANSGWLKLCCAALSLRLRCFSCFGFLEAGAFTTLPPAEGEPRSEITEITHTREKKDHTHILMNEITEATSDTQGRGGGS